MPTSQRKIAANQANSTLSTGPTSAEGKAKVSLNAVKTGLTGRTVLLPTDDVAAYESLIADCTAKWQPATPEESRLVQALADTEWRLLRIPELEAGIYALGFRQCAADFADIEDPAVRRSATRTHIFVTNMRQLSNLSTQEGRLRRHRDQDTKSLEQLQATRKLETRRQLAAAAMSYIEAVAEDRNGDWDPEALGFEFSIEEVERRAVELKPDLFAAWAENQAKAAQEKAA